MIISFRFDKFFEIWGEFCIRFDKRKIRWWKQRRKMGFDERELWNLNDQMVDFLLPRLKAFKEMDGAGCPNDLYDKYGMEEGREQWNQIQDQVLRAFEMYKEIEYPNMKQIKEINKGFALFGKYLQSYWD